MDMKKIPWEIVELKMLRAINLSLVKKLGRINCRVFILDHKRIFVEREINEVAQKIDHITRKQQQKHERMLNQ